MFNRQALDVAEAAKAILNVWQTSAFHPSVDECHVQNGQLRARMEWVWPHPDLRPPKAERIVADRMRLGLDVHPNLSTKVDAPVIAATAKTTISEKEPDSAPVNAGLDSAEAPVAVPVTQQEHSPAQISLPPAKIVCL